MGKGKKKKGEPRQWRGDRHVVLRFYLLLYFVLVFSFNWIIREFANVLLINKKIGLVVFFENFTFLRPQVSSFKKKREQTEHDTMACGMDWKKKVLIV